MGFGFEGTDRLQRETAAFERSHALFMAQVTLAISSSRCAPGVCDLFVFPGLEPSGAHGYEVSAAVFAMKPRPAAPYGSPHATRVRRSQSTMAFSPTPAMPRS